MNIKCKADIFIFYRANEWIRAQLIPQDLHLSLSCPINYILILGLCF